MTFNFLAFKKKREKKIRSSNCNILLPVYFKDLILQIITDIKKCLYAGDMNINRKYEKKKYTETQKFVF